jgi:hypothetical protein
MAAIRISISKVCASFNDLCGIPVIGTKVTNVGAFMFALARAIRAYDATNDRVPGQHFVNVPEAIPLVSAGIGRRGAHGPDQYVLREHRGRVGAFLKRECAAPTEGVAVVVYTREAYMADPEVTPEEIETHGDCTHVVVAVLGFAGPSQPPLTPYRFVSNLAGGNNEALTYTADVIRNMAKAIQAYDDEWCVVAD